MDGYLSRDYSNPLVESEVKGIRFDFLKCLDLYHGPELDAQISQLVIDAGRVDREGSAAPSGA
ncbi:T6SS amidase immunity protein Tai4 family protein [Cupriavidus sp. 30B13]|uniref:T6SS amidase immunity protein Tai4 family protein n=1 Tax=Cupriavidus sp. 30B13 TaxID=3384241 RepID=UPI003B980B72